MQRDCSGTHTPIQHHPFMEDSEDGHQQIQRNTELESTRMIEAELKFAYNGKELEPRSFPDGVSARDIVIEELIERKNFTQEEKTLYAYLCNNRTECARTRGGKTRQIKWKAFAQRWGYNARLAVAHAREADKETPKFYIRSEAQLKAHRKEHQDEQT